MHYPKSALPLARKTPIANQVFGERRRLRGRGSLLQNGSMTGANAIPLAAPYPLAIVMERGSSRGPWGGETWEARRAVPDSSPAGAAVQVIAEDGDATQYLFPGFILRLTPVEAEGYLLNISSPRPTLFVLWRLEEGIGCPKLLSASYHEGTRWADSDEHVDGVALPADLVPWIALFAAAHYRPEPKKKVRYASSRDRGVASRR